MRNNRQASDRAPETFALKRPDYDAVRPEDEIRENAKEFQVEGQMSAIDFDEPTRWRVKTHNQTRTVTVEDENFLNQVAQGLAIRQQDIFWLRIRENETVKNGRRRTKWVVAHVERHRRTAGDDESQKLGPSST